MIRSPTGIVIPKRSKMKAVLLNLNSYRANAYAAISDRTMTPATVGKTTTRLFQKYRPKLPVVQASM
jgi:hypothetical protein